MARIATLFGSLLVLFGALLLLGGAAGAAYGYMDEQEHEEGLGPFGVGHDEDRSARNHAAVSFGLTALGVGVVLLVAGVATLSLRSPERRALRPLAEGDA